ncbi:MAG: hypothetical protein KDD55_11470 [Bdellovibrionales bacterium]|nr:hypothetical protein [Bdellovibrionales bacterium]
MFCHLRSVSFVLFLFSIVLFVHTDSARAELTSEELTLAEELLVGGTCGGSCGVGSCSQGTPTHNCACSGSSASTCKCKGKTLCYNSLGVVVETVECSGSCSWSSTVLPEELAEFLLELLDEE